MKPRVIRMAYAVNYICEYLSSKDISMKEMADITDKLISFEIEDKPIDEEELDKLAWYEACMKYDIHSETENINQHRDDFAEAFKAGYRKAMEE